MNSLIEQLIQSYNECISLYYDIRDMDTNTEQVTIGLTQNQSDCIDSVILTLNDTKTTLRNTYLTLYKAKYNLV